MPLLVEGAYVEGDTFAAIGAGLVIAYDVLDDRLKATPQLPDGIDQEYFQAVADYLAGETRDFRDRSDGRDA